MIKLAELLETNTDIEWWNKNRKRVNRVINCFNDWQVKHQFNNFQKELLKAEIKLCRKYGDKNNFSEWQYELLKDMETFIKEYESQ